jgi:eukaryotic-like serine/threonine-protein kinase
MSELPDDPQVQQWLDAYLEDLHAGRTPDREAILRTRPDLSSALDCLDALNRMAPPGPADEAATLPPTTFAEAGRRIGKYEIERELGRGGMGVVFLARDCDMDRRVALKMILSGDITSSESLYRFQSEVRASAQLDHEGIVRVFDSGEFNGLPYLAMQFIDGPSLAEVLKKSRPDRDWAVRCALQLARAVEYLHSRGIVHRDLKPGNVLLADSIPKITDFGLAKLLSEDSAITRSGVIAGTPSYMSPEQARGESRSVGPAADIHALGAILYEMLTGRPPFSGDSSLDTLLQVLSSEPTPPRKLDSSIPSDLEAICLKCLEKSPERRFASAAQLVDSLERHLKGEDVPAARLSPWQAFSRWVRRNPSLSARLAILAACGMILLIRANGKFDHVFSRTYASVHLYHLWMIFAFWLGLSWLFQRLVRNQRLAAAVPYIWAAFDVTILSSTLLATDSLESPIDVGFPLLIGASGLWLRERLVWFTTGMASLAYGVATVLMYVFGPPNEQLHRHAIFLAGLATMGYLVAYQVERFRALSRYYEGRTQS